MNLHQPTLLLPMRRSIAASLRRMVCALIACGLAGSVAGAQEAGSLEYEVKAAFLVKFARFVEWSTNAPVAGAKGGFTIGILGQDPFGKSFDEAVKKEKIGEHGVQILRGREPGEFTKCQMVFISASESVRLVELIRELSGKGILTVADVPDFAGRGGMIGFIKEAGKVRFEINAAAAEKSGLKISSKLLQVGKRVAGETRLMIE